MRFHLYINQVKAIEWGLKLQEAILFSYLHDLPTWAECKIVDGQAFWWAGKQKTMEELPILTDKPDTIKRHMSALAKAGLIERRTLENKPYTRITEKGKQWNDSLSHSMVGKKIPTESGNISPPSREKNPPYKNTSDKGTNINRSQGKVSAAYCCDEKLLSIWKNIQTYLDRKYSGLNLHTPSELDIDAMRWGLDVDSRIIDEHVCLVLFNLIDSKLGEADRVLNPLQRAMVSKVPFDLWGLLIDEYMDEMEVNG